MRSILRFITVTILTFAFMASFTIVTKAQSPVNMRVSAEVAGPTGPLAVTMSNVDSLRTLVVEGGRPYKLRLESFGATMCQLNSPIVSTVRLNMTTGDIGPSHPWYPAAGRSTTIKIACTDGTRVVLDSLIISRR